MNRVEAYLSSKAATIAFIVYSFLGLLIMAVGMIDSMRPKNFGHNCYDYVGIRILDNGQYRGVCLKCLNDLHGVKFSEQP